MTFNPLIFLCAPGVSKSVQRPPPRDSPAAGHNIPGGVLFITMSPRVLPFSLVEDGHLALSSSSGGIGVYAVVGLGEGFGMSVGKGEFRVFL